MLKQDLERRMLYHDVIDAIIYSSFIEGSKSLPVSGDILCEELQRAIMGYVKDKGALDYPFELHKNPLIGWKQFERVLAKKKRGLSLIIEEAVLELLVPVSSTDDTGDTGISCGLKDRYGTYLISWTSSGPAHIDNEDRFEREAKKTLRRMPNKERREIRELGRRLRFCLEQRNEWRYKSIS